MSVEVTSWDRRSPFDLRAVGIHPDPNKDYRWVRPDRVDERKNMDGYVFTKPSGSKSKSSTGHVKVKGKILMERPRKLRDEAKKRKRQRTLDQLGTTREQMHHDVERLSSEHGKNLHKNIFSEEEDN